MGTTITTPFYTAVEQQLQEMKSKQKTRHFIHQSGRGHWATPSLLPPQCSLTEGRFFFNISQIYPPFQQVRLWSKIRQEVEHIQNYTSVKRPSFHRKELDGAGTAYSFYSSETINILITPPPLSSHHYLSPLC